MTEWTPPPLAQQVDRNLWALAVVCTGQGRHKRTRLSTVGENLMRDGSTQTFMSDAFRHYAPPMKDARPGGGVSRTSYTFLCSLCGRSPVIRRDRWWDAVRKVQEAGLPDIDLGVLSF